MTDDINPATIFQHLDGLRVDRNTTDVFDVAARDGLAISNDGQSLERGTRVLRWLLRIESVEEDLHLGTALEAPASRQLH